MSFLHPAGLWGLLGIPVLILIYIIKPKFKEKLVTSTFIWKLSKKYQKKKLPWQITNLLLFVMQLFTVITISFILARPVLVTKDGAAEKIVILDASASMLVEEKDNSRFQLAKEQIYELADKMESYGKMTVITAGMESRVLVERSDSVKNIKDAVERAECTYGEAALQEAFALAEEALEENPEAAVYLITDKEYEANESINVINVAEKSGNVAIGELRAEHAGNRNILFSADITAYAMDTVATVVLYVDGILADAQMVGLVADVPAVVEFADLGIRDYSEAKVYLEVADAVAFDNEYYLFNEKQTEYEVLLVSEEPTFLEAALMTLDNVVITTVASLEELDLGAQWVNGAVVENIPGNGYDLYIYDGIVPKELPGDGSVWMIHPDRVPKGVTFKLGEAMFSEDYLEKAPDSGTELFAQITKEVSVSDVYINEYVEIYSPLGFETLYTCNDAPMILAGETEHAKTVVFAFDLGASNLPLRIAFPALMHNLLEYSLTPVLDSLAYEVGDTITLNKVSGSVLTSVTANHPAAVAEHYVKLPVSFVAEEPGVYTVSGVLMDETVVENKYFVRYSSSESNLTAAGGVLPEFDTAASEVSYEKEITKWLVIALLVLLLVEYILQHREQFFNKKLSYVIHAVMLLLLIALLAEWKIYREKNEIETILLVDLSDSTESSREVMNAYVKELSASAGKENRIGVVTYAKDSVSVSELSADKETIITDFTETELLPEAGATNLEEALYFAESLLDDKQNQRIIILSDGMETDGDSLAAAKLLAEKGVQIDAVCIPGRSTGYEMQMNSLSHPETLNVGEAVELKAVVESNYEASAEVRFYDNGKVISKRIVTVEQGLTELTAEYTPTSSGVHEISARIIPVNEEIKENNVIYSWLEVKGKGNLLLVDGTGREAKKLTSLLSDEYSITTIEPEEAEAYSNQLVAFDGVILMNVSNADLPEGFDRELENYIKKYGGGVLTSGGANTYAYGSMTDTAFAEFLPVTLEEPEEQTTAMMLVVDTSSSMQGLNHEMAIQGSVQCIETLAETDFVGVITFDRTAKVIYELSSMEEEEEILAAVEAIELGRGTYMTDATKEAFNQLREFEADNKHVIILSDGEPQDSGYIRVVKQMAANGITVSSIAVGHGADRRIMQVIAENGGGNYYNASTVRDLPDIMVEETMAATDSYRQTGNFPITVASYSTLLGGLTVEELPNISGYVTTFHKSGTEQFLTVNGGEPLYVQWNYGSGKVGSFTADLRGNDSEALFESEAGQQLIRNMVSGVIRRDGGITAIDISVAVDNTTANIEISAPVEGREKLLVSVLLPDGSSEQPVEVSLTSSGTYSGIADITGQGVYTITVTHADSNGKLLDFAQKNLASTYSDEYNCFTEENGEVLLQQICGETGGSVAYTAAHVAEFKGDFLEQVADPTVLFLIMTLALFLTDIAIRKFRLKRK